MSDDELQTIENEISKLLKRKEELLNQKAIKIVNDNVLNTTAQIIAHVLSCSNETFNSILNKYPEASPFGKKNIEPGTIIMKKCKDGKYICSMFANKENASYNDRVMWFRDCLNKLSTKKGIKSVSFVREFTNDEWGAYKELICTFARANSNIQVYVHENKEDTKDKEEEPKEDDSEVEVNYKNVSLAEFTEQYTPEGWKDFFTSVKDVIQDIGDKIGKVDVEIYPSLSDIYTAFELCSFNNVKVVILGQDPYYSSPEQAMGLAFSVVPNIKLPPTLQNIYKELADEGFRVNMSNGDLSLWARQGVFLVNTALTVEAGVSNSHKKIWEYFTERLIKYISSRKNHVVFVLWGGNAKGYKKYIDESKHPIIESVHPSPLSAHSGFFGSKPFSKTNKELEKHNIMPIKWHLV